MADSSWAVTIIRWYESESLFWSAVGAWAKFTYEFVTAAAPLILLFCIIGIAVPEVTFSFSLRPDSAIIQWLSLSLTVTGIRWCFTAEGVTPD
ncbi:hypothetical protein BRD20_10190 [Halobacteriales archaeon SW_8_65_20]|nr:MAG: hypothetical protein BRD20_10190 [Halobacteriales archaeon SW_8_65_20]